MTNGWITQLDKKKKKQVRYSLLFSSQYIIHGQISYVELNVRYFLCSLSFLYATLSDTLGYSFNHLE